MYENASHSPNTVTPVNACAACGEWGTPLCRRCRLGLVVGIPRRLEGGLLVLPGLRHEGPARRLVHRLKYRGDPAAARVLAASIAPLLPPDTRALVPVPRAQLRSWRYGVDPALELARALAGPGLAVVRALRAEWWWPGHTGRNIEGRRPPSFRPTGAAPSGSVLVDDVVTTGATFRAASRALDGTICRAVSATGA
jgi:predicted amidophosphoribosyltransferase